MRHFSLSRPSGGRAPALGLCFPPSVLIDRRWSQERCPRGLPPWVSPFGGGRSPHSPFGRMGLMAHVVHPHPVARPSFGQNESRSASLVAYGGVVIPRGLISTTWTEIPREWFFILFAKGCATSTNHNPTLPDCAQQTPPKGDLCPTQRNGELAPFAIPLHRLRRRWRPVGIGQGQGFPQP